MKLLYFFTGIAVGAEIFLPLSNLTLYAGSADAWRANAAGKNPMLEIGIIIGVFLSLVVLSKWIKKWKNRKK